MNRKYRYNYGTSPVQKYDRMKIAPPLFPSIADAYKHFVRHPEERQVVDNPDGWRPFGDSLDDCFDRMDSVVDGLLSPSAEPAADNAVPPAVAEPEEAAAADSEDMDPS